MLRVIDNENIIANKCGRNKHKVIDFNEDVYHFSSSWYFQNINKYGTSETLTGRRLDQVLLQEDVCETLSICACHLFLLHSPHPTNTHPTLKNEHEKSYHIK